MDSEKGRDRKMRIASSCGGDRCGHGIGSGDVVFSFSYRQLGWFIIFWAVLANVACVLISLWKDFESSTGTHCGTKVRPLSSYKTLVCHVDPYNTDISDIIRTQVFNSRNLNIPEADLGGLRGLHPPSAAN